MKRFLLLFLFTNSLVFAQTCPNGSEDTFPLSSSKFEQFLVQKGIDRNGITGNILECDAQSVTVLDLSQPINAQDLDKFNNFDIADLYRFENLISLNLENNLLANTFSVPSALTKLEVLNVNNCTLPQIDVQFVDSLKELYCNDNALQVINFTNNLEILECANNRITNLNIRNLKRLKCNNNVINSLAILAGNYSLEYLDCSYNAIQALQLSEYPLTYLNCSNNLLQNLDASSNSYSFIRFENNESTLEFLNISNTNLSSVTNRNGILKSLKANNCEFLRFINIGGNLITNIELNNSVNIETLRCSSNQISNLDTSNLTQLSLLWCNSNSLSDLNLQNNTLLTELFCSSNNLQTLDILNNVLLANIDCSDNNLTEFNTSSNAQLIDVDCADNQIVSLDFSNNTLLENLQITTNDITTSDTYLQSLDISNTKLTSLKSSGINSISPISVINLSNFNAENCANISSVSLESDNFNTVTIQNCPVISEIYITSRDNRVGGVTGGSIANNLNIQNTPSLTRLTCSAIGLTNLNLSSFTNLEYLDCSANSLIEIDASNNNNLKELLFGNITLENLNVSNTKLTTISTVNSSAPNLINIDASNCSALTYIAKFNPQFDTTPYNLESLNLENCNSLQRISVTNNKVSNLNINNTDALEEIYMQFNDLTDLNLSQNSNLTAIDIENNKLENLNVKNGNNTNLNFLRTRGNNNLLCIEVDDPVLALSRGNWRKDNTTSYSYNCANSSGHPDYDALVSFYNSTNGANWTNNTNWLDTNKPLSEWYGITETNGRVTSINLRQNNLTGSIPDAIGDLTSLTFIDLAVNNLTGEIPSTVGNIQTLEWLDLAVNNLTGGIPNQLTSLSNLTRIAFGYNNLSGDIPDFISQNLFVFTIDNNKFQFGDFEDQFVSYQNNIAQFLYAPQQNPDENFITEQTLNIGDDATLNAASVNGTNTFYQWYSEGSPINGATSTTLELQNLQLSEMGVYQCYAFNSTVTGLTLRTAIHTINRVNTLHPEYNDLVAFYSATDGDNWTNNTNWLTDAPINTWYGIGTLRGDGNSRVTSIYLNNNNLSGSIPEEIGNFSNLFNLELGGNNLYSTVPQSITNLTELGGLALQANNLSGDFPNLTALPLNYLDISYNNFKFTDIADEFFTYQSNIPSFSFTPQYTIDLPVETNANIGDDITLTLSDIPSTAKGMTKKTKLADNFYQWYKDDVALSINANSNTYTITNAQNSDSGVYHCEITNADVPNMIIRRQEITLNIGALNTEGSDLKFVSVYPNPIKNILNIKLNNSENALLYLHDINGRLILNQKLNTELNIINIENLNPSIYILKIKTHSKTYTKRLIKR